MLFVDPTLPWISSRLKQNTFSASQCLTKYRTIKSFKDRLILHKTFYTGSRQIDEYLLNHRTLFVDTKLLCDCCCSQYYKSISDRSKTSLRNLKKKKMSESVCCLLYLITDIWAYYSFSSLLLFWHSGNSIRLDKQNPFSDLVSAGNRWAKIFPASWSI